ncbi:GNAT family N-acetyltransferase [Gaetbulibacter sp. 4G1]|nr:GNAT family N-acetyltransferase [Gaetbulibacter sp. 4G1]PIA80375.1 GNAT family N-acetyltransferase [Gaetbulibacter sp. 4G1]
MIEITLAQTQPDYILIEELADVIWRKHYIPITGIGQVEHMLKKYQSAEAISKQVEDEGFEYFILRYDKTPVGYISIRKEEGKLFLSKIYVLSEYRGKKIGKTAMQFIEEKAKAYGLKTIMLTVNKNNTNSIKAYEKLGFINVCALVKDIGNGYVMDDYQMEKKV